MTWRPGSTRVMMDRVPAATQRERDDLVRLVGRARDSGDVFVRASSRLQRLVPFDAAAWVGADPATGLPSGPIHTENVEGLTPDECAAHWHREFTVADVTLFRDLVRASSPVGALRSTVGDPVRSPRFRRFVRPLGFDDELRAVMRSAGTPWGMFALWRRVGQPQFSAREAAVVGSLSEGLGSALRLHARRDGLPEQHDLPRPGLLMFDQAVCLVAADEPARRWLDELPTESRMPTDYGVDLPLWVVVAVLRARAVTHGSGDGTARVRVRTRRGTWLAGYATCLQREDGAYGDVAVVLEPAAQNEIAPIVVEAYGLTTRERQITRLLARGAQTAEIAEELHLSRHTVRDHVKAILRKVGVSSRGKLVAKLFAEHFLPNHHDVRRTPGAAAG